MRKGISVLKHQCLQLRPLHNCMPSSALWNTTLRPTRMGSTETRCRRSQFKLWRRLMLKDNSIFRKPVKNPEKMKTGQVLWSITSRAVRRIRVWSLRPAIESERRRLPNQEPFLSHEAPRRGYSHQQQVIEVQKHVDEAPLRSF